MQDRFKFRCWHEPTETMYEVFDFNENFIRATPDLVVPSIRTLNAMNCVLMQCTGLKDKNGKLIYEGDIVSVKVQTQDFFNVEEYYSENYKGEIIFKEGEFAIRVIDTKKQPIALYYYANGCEVIGNIYENPELLENKQ